MPLIRSISVSGSIPTVTQLALGDLAINTFDGKVYIKKYAENVETIIEVGNGEIPPTASFAISASYAITASYLEGSVDTAENANKIKITDNPTYAGVTFYPTFVSNTSGYNSVLVDSSLFTYNPSTNTLTVTSSQAETASYAIFAETASLTEYSDLSRNTIASIKNVSGVSFPKGTPLYVTESGVSGNLLGVIPADAGDPSLMPAGVISAQDLNDGDEGIGYIDGFINGVDTSAFNSGDEVFVGVGGGYTNVRPTGSALIQPLGYVEKVDSTNGSGLINGPGHYFEVPNISSSYLWVGNADQVAVPVSTASLHVSSSIYSSYTETASYVNPLNQDVIITGSLTVSGSSTFTNIGPAVLSGSLTVADEDSSVPVNIIRNDSNGALPVRITNNHAGGRAGLAFFLPNNNQSYSIGADNDRNFKIGEGSLSSKTKFTITPSDNVGIGTTSPTSKLHVKGSGTTSSTTALRVENANASGSLVVFDDGTMNAGKYNVYPIKIIDTGSKAEITGSILTDSLIATTSINANAGMVSSGSVAISGGTLGVVSTGTSNATSGLKVQNSTPEVTLEVKDDGELNINTTKYSNNGVLTNNGGVVEEVAGWTGIININTIPPIAIDVQNGIIVNVT